jgi:hypothetical protein
MRRDALEERDGISGDAKIGGELETVGHRVLPRR